MYLHESCVKSRHFAFSACLFITAVAQWLRCCATNRKVAGSIPADVSGFFIDIKSFRSHYGPGVDLVSNKNEYQEYLLGVKKWPVRKADNLTTILGYCHVIWEP